MSMGERTSYHPKFYRVTVQTVAGPVSVDVDTLEEAREAQKANTRQHWPVPVIRACWYLKGKNWIDSEIVR